MTSIAGFSASAQDAAPSPVEEARTRFQTGVELAEQGNCSGAIAEFQASYDLVPRPNTLFNIARCQEQLFRYDLAIEAYERYLGEAPATDPDRATVEATMRTLRNLLGTVHVQSNVPAEVWAGDRLVGQAPGDVLVPGGHHVFELRAEGYLPVRREVEVAGQRRVEMEATLQRAENQVNITRNVTEVTHTETRVERGGLPPVVFWSGVAATAVAAGVGGIFGMQALGDKSSAEDLDPRLPKDDEIDSIKNKALLADVFFTTALVFAVGTTVIGFMTQWKDDPEEPAPGTSARVSLAPILSPHGAGVTITGAM